MVKIDEDDDYNRESNYLKNLNGDMRPSTTTQKNYQNKQGSARKLTDEKGDNNYDYDS
jgi:hypothetical protein